METGMRKIENS